jgi:hypothetical protein
MCSLFSEDEVLTTTFQVAMVDVVINDFAETANGTQLKFADDAKLRAFANASKNNIVINKLMMDKNTGKEKREREETSESDTELAHFGDVI